MTTRRLLAPLALTASILAGCAGLVVPAGPVVIAASAGPSALPSASAAPSTAPTATPTPAPSATPTTAPTATPTASLPPTRPATVDLKGEIRNPLEGHLVLDATIHVRSLDPIWPFVTEVAAKDGLFEVPGLRTGAKVELEINADGYKTLTEPVILSSGGPFTFEMERGAASPSTVAKPSKAPEPTHDEGPDPSIDLPDDVEKVLFDLGGRSLLSKKLREVWDPADDRPFTDKPKDGWWQCVSLNMTKDDPLDDDEMGIRLFHMKFEKNGRVTVAGEKGNEGDTWGDGDVSFIAFCYLKYPALGMGGTCRLMDLKAIASDRLVDRRSKYFVDQLTWVGE